MTLLDPEISPLGSKYPYSANVCPSLLVKSEEKCDGTNAHTGRAKEGIKLWRAMDGPIRPGVDPVGQFDQDP